MDKKANKAGTTDLSSYDSGVNDIGQRTSVNASGDALSTEADWNWGYNTRGEVDSAEHTLTTASSRHYTFDTIGNRTEHRVGTHTDMGGTATGYYANTAGTTAGANPLNQYARITFPGSINADPGFDTDGNMTDGPVPVAPTLNAHLDWNGENRLLIATPSGVSATRYLYDGLGRRVAKTAGTMRTYFLHDDWNLIAEYTGDVPTTGTPVPNLTLRRTWAWGTDLSGSAQGAGGVGGLLAVNLTGASADTYYPLYDGNGNITEYVNSSASVAAHFEYDPFGRIYSSSGATADFTYRFSTKPQDPETGLYYYGYRYYDPVAGRWPSRDPIEEDGGINLYGHVQNNPLRFLDLLGLEPITIDFQTRIKTNLYGFTSGVKTNHVLTVETTSGDITGESIFIGTTWTIKGGGKLSSSATVTDSNDGGFLTTVKLTGYVFTGVRALPRIDYSLTITIESDCGGIMRKARLAITHDGFPTYQFLFQKSDVYNHQEGLIGELFGDSDVSDSKQIFPTLSH